MSHYTKVKTQLSDKACLVKALSDVGFTEGKVRISDTPIHLEGYQGDTREQTAEIVIPRSHVGNASNDIGFKEQEDGTYGAIISDYDKSRYNDKWLKKLNQRYAYHKVKDQIESQGLFIEEETEENGEIFLSIDAGAFGG